MRQNEQGSMDRSRRQFGNGDKPDRQVLSPPELTPLEIGFDDAMLSALA